MGLITRDYVWVELRQLVYFDAIVRLGGFTRAAEQLYVAQPAISAQIRRLEKELGTVLLQRNSRRVSLTHAGELFWDHTRQVLDQLAAARADLDELSSVTRGRVCIGATEALGSLDLPSALAAFRRRYPDVALKLTSGLIVDLLAGLEAGEIDVVLGPMHSDQPPRFAAQVLVEESLVLVTPPGHPLAYEESGRLSAARDEHFICLPTGSGLNAILVEAATAEGFVPQIEFETYSPASIRELVSAGLGVALLAGSVARGLGPPINIYPLKPSPRHPPISIMVTRSPPPSTAAMAFHTYLCATLSGRPRADDGVELSPEQRSSAPAP
jgi:LysR family transcriptional activator of glutamate synthase operon